MLDDRTESDAGLAGSGEHPDGRDLTFPDLPRLELDQLLAQLVERAQEVMATQGRLRGLLRANQHDHRRSGAARRCCAAIVEAARELVGARYAALGVIAPDGGLAEFVHVGMPADRRRPDRAPAAGQGPARRADRRAATRSGSANLADDARSSGFPQATRR